MSFSSDDHILVHRARLYAIIRRFFSAQNVLEVDVPVLGASRVSDPNLESLSLQCGEEIRYLQTSPEYFLKRVLSGYPHSIYFLGKAFRANELGQYHNTEFTLLEWYKVGLDDRELIGEVFDLICQINPLVPFNQYSYTDVFQKNVGINPHSASLDELQAVARKLCHVTWDDPFRATWLDLLFTHVVEPNLPDGVVAVLDYPECQSALARIKKNGAGDRVARRFEVYWNRVEIGNGYWELTDADEQRRRFEEDNNVRRLKGLPGVVIDQAFVAALEKGIPHCAGIAMGVDRILMCALGLNDIHSVMAFSDHNI